MAMYTAMAGTTTEGSPRESFVIRRLGKHEERAVQEQSMLEVNEYFAGKVKSITEGWPRSSSM